MVKNALFRILIKNWYFSNLFYFRIDRRGLSSVCLPDTSAEKRKSQRAKEPKSLALVAAAATRLPLPLAAALNWIGIESTTMIRAATSSAIRRAAFRSSSSRG